MNTKDTPSVTSGFDLRLAAPGILRSTPDHFLSPTFLPKEINYTTYTLRYTIPAETHFHVFLGDDRIGGGGTGEGSFSGVVVLTRCLLERVEELEKGVVVPYLRELGWVVENDDGTSLELSTVKGLKVKVASAVVSVWEQDVKPKWVFHELVVDGKRGGIR